VVGFVGEEEGGGGESAIGFSSFGQVPLMCEPLYSYSERGGFSALPSGRAFMTNTLAQ